MEYIVVALIGIILGYRAARAKNRRTLKKLNKKHTAERHENFEKAYLAGARDALADPREVKRAYETLYATR